MTISTDDNESEEVWVSKTQKKKEDHGLQILAEKLTELSEVQLERMELPDRILKEISIARNTKVSGAKKRQIKFIGGMLRNVDTEPIEKAINYIDQVHYEQAQAFKKIEEWRDRLKAGNMDLVNEILSECPNAERQQLSQLARNAKKEAEQNGGTKASKALFRYLKEVSEE